MYVFVYLKGIIMIFGWVFFIINVSLFYFGISDYRKFVICFLFEILDRVLLGNIF